MWPKAFWQQGFHARVYHDFSPDRRPVKVEKTRKKINFEKNDLKKMKKVVDTENVIW